MNHIKQIILASDSPRRKELLEKAGIRFKVVKNNCEEYLDPKLNPHELAKKLSLKKAKAVSENHKDSIVIAADTLVVCESIILGKPKDEKDAKKILKILSGKAHFVITGYTIINGNKVVAKSEETKVYMKKLSSKEIDGYIATKEPFGKAGAYAIQEKGSMFIKKIIGSYPNAVGLPIYSLIRELKKLGAEVL